MNKITKNIKDDPYNHAGDIICSNYKNIWLDVHGHVTEQVRINLLVNVFNGISANILRSKPTPLQIEKAYSLL